MLDLNGDGITITPLSGIDSVKFDTDGDGLRSATAWVGADDGLLVWDRNGNGTIDSGAELFGDETVLADGQKAADGFAALAELDSNHDGSFDFRDAPYAGLRIWRDLNQDGISQAGELKTLADSGVSSIGLTATAPVGAHYTDAQLMRTGHFGRTGSNIPGQIGSFLLGQNAFYTEFSTVPLTDAARTLPDIAGSGKVRGLREAASLNPELIDKLHAVQNAPTRAAYGQAVSDLMLAWGNDSGYQSLIEAGRTQGYGLILSEPQDEQEKGWMDTAVKADPDARNAFRATLSTTDLAQFDAMRERMVGDLERLAAYEAFTGFTFLPWTKVRDDAFRPPDYNGAVGGRPVVVSEPLSQIIAERRSAAPAAEAGYIVVTIPTPPVGQPHITTLWNRLVDDAGYNLMPSLRLQPYLDAVELGITDKGVSFDFSAMDSMVASVMNTSHREGALLVMDIERVFGNSLDPLGWNGGEQVRSLLQQARTDVGYQQAFNDVGYALPVLGASNGEAGSDAYAGDEAANTFNAGDGDDLLDGAAGNDTLSGGLGNDRIYGGSGNDLLYGDDGNDTLDGGAGNDTLSGGAGNNTYLFGRGDGQDVIDGSFDASAKLDVLQFKPGVAASDIQLTRVDFNLVLSIAGTTDKLTVSRFFWNDNPLDPYNPVQQLRFADGTSWSIDDVEAKTIAGDDTAQTLTGYGGADLIDGLGGNDLILGQAGNDTIYGGGGNDTLRGGAGDDLLFGGAGDDSLDGGWGDDTLDGGAGNDRLDGYLGNNTYLFGRGDGQDVIDGSFDASAKLDVLQFKPGVAASDIQLTRVDFNLVLSIAGTTDKLTVSRFFWNDNPLDPYNPVQQLRFADGTSWSIDDVKANAKAKTIAGDDTNAGGSLEHVDLFAGITASQLEFAKNADDPAVTGAGDASDRLVAKNWHASTVDPIEEFSLSDGGHALASQVQGLVNAMAQFDAPNAMAGAMAGAGAGVDRAHAASAHRYADLAVPTVM